jgi:hypothetical protein
MGDRRPIPVGLICGVFLAAFVAVVMPFVFPQAIEFVEQERAKEQRADKNVPTEIPYDWDDVDTYKRELVDLAIGNRKRVDDRHRHLKNMNRDYGASLSDQKQRGSFRLSESERFAACLELIAASDIYRDQLDTPAGKKHFHELLARIHNRHRIDEDQAAQIVEQYAEHDDLVRPVGHKDLRQWKNLREELETGRTEDRDEQEKAEARYLAAVPAERDRQARFAEELKQIEKDRVKQIDEIVGEMRDRNAEYFVKLEREGKLNGERFGLSAEQRREYFYRFAAITDVYCPPPKHHRNRFKPELADNSPLFDPIRKQFGLSPRQAKETELEFDLIPGREVRQLRITSE